MMFVTFSTGSSSISCDKVVTEDTTFYLLPKNLNNMIMLQCQKRAFCFLN